MWAIPSGPNRKISLCRDFWLERWSFAASDPMLQGGEIVSGMSHLAGVLATRQYPRLRMTIEYHPGMGHTDVMGTSVVRGLRSLYAK